MKNALASGIATFLLIGALPSANAETRAVTCKMSGTVEVKPGLKAPSPSYDGEPYKVKIRGKLSGCQGSQAVPGSATLRANGEGEGTCVLRSLVGKASLKWDNRNETTFDFSTHDVASALVLTSTITKSNEPAMPEGDGGGGTLRFESDTSKCNTSDGVRSATFEGQLSSGSPG